MFSLVGNTFSGIHIKCLAKKLMNGLKLDTLQVKSSKEEYQVQHISVQV